MTIHLKRINRFGDVNGGGGGDRYQKVDYIESSGAAWCSTGIKPDDTTVMKFQCIMKNHGGDTFIGGQNPNNPDDDFRFFRAPGTTYLDYGGSGSGNRITTVNIGADTTKKYKVEVGNLYIKDVDNNVIVAQKTPVAFAEKPYAIKVFSARDYGSLFYLQIEKGGVLVRDYIPVLDTKTNIYGLYDRVTEIFVPSAGNADFTGGNEA